MNLIVTHISGNEIVIGGMVIMAILYITISIREGDHRHHHDHRKK
jgi:hypothetical protein